MPAAQVTSSRRPVENRSEPAVPLRVLVISGSVGAGHNGTAAELALRLRARGVDAECRDFLDALPSHQRSVLREGYSLTAARLPVVFDWFFRHGEHAGVAQRLTWRVCRTAEAAVARWTREGEGYDAVVTTFPFAAQTLGELRRTGRLRVPAVCYLTDPAPHRLWVHGSLDAHLTVTPATAAEGAQRYGVPMEAAGPLVGAAFADALPDSQRAQVRAELGVPADSRMALMVAGSLGLGDVSSAVRDLLSVPGTVPVVLCGRNARLRARVAMLPGAVALGWRDDVPRLMAAADVLVHNAGGLSFTEALVAGLPAVSYRVISGHGLANADTLARHDLAPWPRCRTSLADALVRQAHRGRVPLPALPPGRDVTSIVVALAHRSRADRDAEADARSAAVPARRPRSWRSFRSWDRREPRLG